MHIQQAFEMLVARWGIFWKPLRFSLWKSTRIVSLATELHKFCIDEDNGCIRKVLSTDDIRDMEIYFELGWIQMSVVELQVVEAMSNAALCGLNLLRALGSKEFLVLFVESSIFNSDPVRKSVALVIFIHPLQ